MSVVFPISVHFISCICLIVLGRTSNIKFIDVLRAGIPFLFSPNLKEKSFIFHHFSIILAIGFFHRRSLSWIVFSFFQFFLHILRLLNILNKAFSNFLGDLFFVLWLGMWRSLFPNIQGLSRCLLSLLLISGLIFPVIKCTLHDFSALLLLRLV